MKLEQLSLILPSLLYIISFTLANEQPTQEDPLKFAKDTGHIKEHLQHQYGFTNEQAEQYLKEYDAQTQFFVMHDYDNNTRLDGLELLKSMTHFHDEHDEEHKENKDEPEVDQTDTLVEFVDMILKDQDFNKDGYIDYPEYISYYTKYEQQHTEKPQEAAEAAHPAGEATEQPQAENQQPQAENQQPHVENQQPHAENQ